MKKGVVISDTGPIFSLALVEKLDVLDEIFGEVYIPNAVWEELTRDKTTKYYNSIVFYFKDKVKNIKSSNDLTFIMDFGESEAVVLYREIKADFLLIDDKKARKIAESLEIECVGTIGILLMAKKNNIINELRPIFKTFLKNNRYYSVKFLNAILEMHNEKVL